MHRQAFLRERVCQRRRVPVVFRYRYSPDFEETIEENKLRNHLLDRALRNHERIIGPRGLTKEERQEISKRFADPIALDPEWPYVWEQFERDIPRETLFVEDTPYHDAHDALAAILSYVEYSYDRGQQHIAEKSAAALAAAKNSGGAFTTAAGAPKEKTFLRHFISAGTAALKDAVVTMRSNLPDFLGDRLLTVSGYDPALYHASLVFPTDPQARSEKIFEAVREVVLASQQSFMGFPYQLLCEQVGTERLCLALDALERDQAEDHDHLDEGAEAETTARVSSGHAMRNEKRVTTSSSSEASASIPIKETENQEDLVTQNSLLEQTSLHSSRVAHIHEYPHLTTTKDRSGNVHHDCCHTIDAVDEKLVASPMPEQEVGEQPVVGLGAILAHCLSETERRRREIVARRSRERRRRRQERMPLLVGEPRPHEFDAFVNIVRDQCIAKEVREERKKKATQRCEQVQQIPKRQCEHQRSVPTSPQELHLGSPPFSFAPLDSVKKTNEAPLAATEQAAGTANSPRKLFREDIEGSTYLIPARSATAAMEAALLYSSRPPLSQTLAREVATSPETRGMRICLFFDEKRNVPVVVVNKLFRLFTVPGLSGPISSEDDTPEALNGEATAKTGAANPNPPAPQSGAGRTGSLKKSLLLLIQVHFALFLKEEVEIRWKWWKL
ncbi:hypothetical protein JKF63_01662 [Porcisia hertigi]|uniref:Uncharacterized protein n=1 Tax=Porcisia hertigi TaxID=2761500 RepID=A0A836HZU1_9TRYP|nr:hypothetical protein JKF63_01662 [Porcisia hertigi]